LVALCTGVAVVTLELRSVQQNVGALVVGTRVLAANLAVVAVLRLACRTLARLADVAYGAGIAVITTDTVLAYRGAATLGRIARISGTGVAVVTLGHLADTLAAVARIVARALVAIIAGFLVGVANEDETLAGATTVLGARVTVIAQLGGALAYAQLAPVIDGAAIAVVALELWRVELEVRALAGATTVLGAIDAVVTRVGFVLALGLARRVQTASVDGAAVFVGAVQIDLALSDDAACDGAVETLVGLDVAGIRRTGLVIVALLGVSGTARALAVLARVTDRAANAILACATVDVEVDTALGGIARVDGTGIVVVALEQGAGTLAQLALAILCTSVTVVTLELRSVQQNVAALVVLA
jgi:hypothetical protein